MIQLEILLVNWTPSSPSSWPPLVDLVEHSFSQMFQRSCRRSYCRLKHRLHRFTNVTPIPCLNNYSEPNIHLQDRCDEIFFVTAPSVSPSATSAQSAPPVSPSESEPSARPILLVEGSVEQGVDQTVGKSQQGQLITMMLIMVMIMVIIIMIMITMVKRDQRLGKRRGNRTLSCPSKAEEHRPERHRHRHRHRHGCLEKM